MSLENDLFTALGAIPEFHRTAPDITAVVPITFPQPVRWNPVWPALRYTFVSAIPVEDLCGDGDDTTADVRVQLDIVAEDHVVVRQLRLDVMAVMATFGVDYGWPAILILNFDNFDAETQTYRCTLDYMITPSSELGSP